MVTLIMWNSRFLKIMAVIILGCLFKTATTLPMRAPNFGFFNPLPRQTFLNELTRPKIPLFPQINFGIQNIPLPVSKRPVQPYYNNNIDFKHIEPQAVPRIIDKDKDNITYLNRSDLENSEYNDYKSVITEKEDYLENENNDLEETWNADAWDTETTTDITTTTDNNFESTTFADEDVFNRMAAPPAVVASLLG